MPIPSVSVIEVQHEVLLDVREVDEWQEVRAPNAVLVPMSELVARVDELPATRPLNVICHVGGRSARVVEWLVAQGIDARNVLGGMDAWEAAGLPVERG